MGRTHFEVLGTYIKMVLKSQSCVWVGFMWIGLWISDELYGHSNEPSGFIEGI